MKENYYWILIGISIGLLFYLGDKYIFKGAFCAPETQFILSNIGYSNNSLKTSLRIGVKFEYEY